MSTDKIVVAGIPLLDDQGHREAYALECNLCGPIAILTVDEDAVHQIIANHMKDDHGVSPEDYAFKDI